MTTTIQERLTAIAQEHQINILFSCESGSRGWEFPSPDSDFDVRFIYTRSLNEYLSIDEREDNLGFPINDELDIYGWDLRKVLQLIRRSNTTPFEWLQSPIIYREQPGFRDELWRLCQAYFSQRSNIHHYLGIATGALATIDNNDGIRIKKLFYVLRPLLAAKWCLEKNTIAPMTIGPLMSLLPGNLQNLVADLIRLKATAAESFLIPIDPVLKAYIDQEMIRCSEASRDLPKGQFGTTGLNEFFRKIIASK